MKNLRDADERVDVVWRDITGFDTGLGYPVVCVWTGIQFEDVVNGAGRAEEPDDLREWANDIAAVLREGFRVAMSDTREGLEL